MTDYTTNTAVHSPNNLTYHIQNACDWANMRNWRVFPTDANTKRPCIKDPFGRATNEREQVIKLFSQYPDSGLGIPTGPSNGITVIDVDIKNGIDGWFNLRALEIDIPLTGLVRTPSGGFHLYFDTGDLEVPNSASSFAQGVDVRGAGGYVQGPGTVNFDGKYWWDQRYLSPLGKLSKMPTGLLRHCMGANLEDEYSNSWKRSPVREELLDPVIKGNRNNTMAQLGGYLIRKLDKDLAWKAMQHINETCCKPPLKFRELERTFRSILKRDLRSG